MYKRKDGNRDMCLDILHAENQMKIQNDKIGITIELIQQSMHENFNLFFNAESAVPDNHSNSKLSKCSHNLMDKKMESMRSIGKSSEHLRPKVRVCPSISSNYMFKFSL